MHVYMYAEANLMTVYVHFNLLSDINIDIPSLYILKRVAIAHPSLHHIVVAERHRQKCFIDHANHHIS